MEKINLAELLKDCPEGMELYSPLFGKVYFKCLNVSRGAMLLYTERNIAVTFYLSGKYFNYPDSECLLFPSKENRDWSKFVSPCQFKDGDVVAGENCACSYITIFRKFIDDTSFSHHVCLTSFGNFKVEDISDNTNLRFATEEEKQKLFDAIKDNGYKWNPETKNLEKLVEPKFKVGDRVKYKNGKNINGVEQGVILSITDDTYDVAVTNNMGVFVSIAEQDEWELVPNKFDINTLKPFDKVLVRDNDEQFWTVDFFGFQDDRMVYKFACVGHCVNQCIPYEGNEHLLGTTNDCDDYYKNYYII